MKNNNAGDCDNVVFHNDDDYNNYSIHQAHQSSMVNSGKSNIPNL